MSVSARARSRAVSACLSVKPERCTVLKLFPLALHAACTLAKSNRSGVFLGVSRKSMRDKCRFPLASLRWFESPVAMKIARRFSLGLLPSSSLAANPCFSASCSGARPDPRSRQRSRRIRRRRTPTSLRFPALLQKQDELAFVLLALLGCEGIVSVDCAPFPAAPWWRRDPPARPDPQDQPVRARGLACSEGT